MGRLLSRRSVWLLLGIGFVATIPLPREAAAVVPHWRCTPWTGTAAFCQPNYACPSGYKRQASHSNCFTGFKTRCCRRVQ
jgi:hypothetical protein